MKQFYRTKGRSVASVTVTFSAAQLELLHEVAHYDGFEPEQLSAWLQNTVVGLLDDFADDATFARQLNRKVVRRFLKHRRR